MGFWRGLLMVFAAACAALFGFLVAASLIVAGVEDIAARDDDPEAYAQVECAAEGLQAGDAYTACVDASMRQSFLGPGMPELIGGLVVLAVTAGVTTITFVVVKRRHRGVPQAVG